MIEKINNFSLHRYVPSNFVKKEKRSLLDKLMPKKSKRVNSATSSDISKDLSDLNIDTSNNNSTLQSDQSNENLNISSEFKQKLKAIVKYKYSAKKYVVWSINLSKFNQILSLEMMRFLLLPGL